MLTGGSVPGVLATVNFGARGARGLRDAAPAPADGSADVHGVLVRLVRPLGRRSTSYGIPRTRRGALREILECGASVNVYMAHGGTSFAGWAGANRAGGADLGEVHEGALEPDVTSYDYDAPIDEYGRPTEKFWRFREVLSAYADSSPARTAARAPCVGRPGRHASDGWAPLTAVLDALGGPETEHAVPPTFEELDVDRGLVRYTVTVPGPRRPYPLSRARAAGPGGGVRRRGAGRGARRGGRAAGGAGRGARARGAVGGVPGAGQLRAAHRRAEGRSPGACCTSGSICTGCGRAGCGWTRSRRVPYGRCPSRGCPPRTPRGCTGGP